MGKGPNRRRENFKQVQDNWPVSMGKKPYWATYSKFSDEFYKENPELLDNDIQLKQVDSAAEIKD